VLLLYVLWTSIFFYKFFITNQILLHYSIFFIVLKIAIKKAKKDYDR